MGVDPGLANLGIGVVEGDGRRQHHLFHDCLRSDSQTPLADRLLAVHQAVGAALQRFSPDAVALEEQFLRRQADVAFKVGQACGVIELACAQAEVPVYRYGPMQVKSALVGAGRADKAQVIYMVGALLGQRELGTHHAADALALALTHLASCQLAQRTARLGELPSR